MRDRADKLNATPHAGAVKSIFELVFCCISPRVTKFLPFGQNGFVQNKTRNQTAFVARRLLRRYIGAPDAATFTLLDPRSGAISTARANAFVRRALFKRELAKTVRSKLQTPSTCESTSRTGLH